MGPFELPAGTGRRKFVRIYEPVERAAGPRPVLMMFDGQNVFDDAPSFAGGWHVDRAVERLAKTVARPVVIAVDHGGVHRTTELSPFVHGRHQGELERQLWWLRAELLPRLRAELNLSDDPRRVVVGGASMGGLAALYACLRYPETFGGAIAMSPSLWLAHGAMYDWLATHGATPGLRIYLDAGAKEAHGRMLAGARRLGAQLAATGRVELYFRADPRGRHRELDWRRRLLPALRFHFGKSR